MNSIISKRLLTALSFVICNLAFCIAATQTIASPDGRIIVQLAYDAVAFNACDSKGTPEWFPAQSDVGAYMKVFAQ